MYPERLIIETTTRCNLHCAICPKQSPNYHQPEMDMDFETFTKLSPLFPYLKSLVLSGIGEPLLHPSLEDFISYAKQRMPKNASIGFQTNGVLLTQERMNELIKAGLNKICVSIDSLVPVSGLHDPEFAKRALEIVASTRTNGKKPLHSGIEIVITKDNLDQIIPTIIEAAKYNIGFVILSHLIPYSPEATQKVAYETNNKEAVRIFKKWYARLLKKGYSTDDWLEQIKKKALPEFHPKDSEPIRLFKAMYNEAEKKGITLHLNNLIGRDEEVLNGVEKVLKEVANLKQKLNLKIKLPRTNPHPKRNCDFLEEKCMFIGVDGEVSPCYFLWHSFTCYISGLKKSIKRWSFGNLNEKNPIEIFNSKPYQHFMESVLRYDFPYCYDCNFALCDLMELEEFIYDCYTNDVPCGACLWCGGLFYCLI